MSEAVITSVFASIGTILAAVATYIASKKAPADKVEKLAFDTKELEHRLTVLEENRFSSVDKECLQEIKTKMGFLWDAFKTFPAFLKKESTPDLDKIWSKAEKNIKALTVNEAKVLLKAMDDEIDEAVKTENNIPRAFIATIYKAVFKYELETKNDRCK